MSYKFTTIGYADVSTTHIMESDSHLMSLSVAPCRLAAECDNAGCFFYVPEVKADWDALKRFGFSSAFLELFKQLQAAGIGYVRIRANGYEAEGAPVFDW